MEIKKAKPKVIAVIPARLGSQRFPGKILAEINGKPLIQYVYENTTKCPLLDSVVVAVDDPSIYNTIIQFGGKAVMTPTTCFTGTDRIIEALKNKPELVDANFILNVQGDEPCLEPDVMSQVIEALIYSPDADVSTAVIKFQNIEDALSTSRPKCVIDQQGYALYFSRGLIPYGHKGYQPSETYYGHLGIYCYRKDFILRYGEIPPSPLQLVEDLEQLKVIENGFRIKVAIVKSTSIGVDTPEDLKKVESIICQKNTCLSLAESVPH